MYFTTRSMANSWVSMPIFLFYLLALQNRILSWMINIHCIFFHPHWPSSLCFSRLLYSPACIAYLGPMYIDWSFSAYCQFCSFAVLTGLTMWLRLYISSYYYTFLLPAHIARSFIPWLYITNWPLHLFLDFCTIASLSTSKTCLTTIVCRSQATQTWRSLKKIVIYYPSCLFPGYVFWAD